MDEMKLEKNKIAILVADLYEDTEFWYPYYRMKEAGAEVVALGPTLGPEEVHSKHGLPARMEKRTKDVNPDDFDAVIIPGGYAPDLLRRCPSTLKFVRRIAESGKVTAAICHAGWVLISAGVINGKRATSFFSIRDDMINAGADWVDEEVVVDWKYHHLPVASGSARLLPGDHQGLGRMMGSRSGRIIIRMCLVARAAHILHH